MHAPRLSFVAIVLVVLGALAGHVACSPAPAPPPDPLAGAQPSRPEDVSDGNVLGISFLGDSLTEGLGLQSQQAYPYLIGEMFAAEGYGEVEVINGGVSGDTTAGGLRRVEQLLTPTTKILVVALGGNDALRGLTVARTRDNVAAIIEGTLEGGVGVLLAGMEAPTNLGEDYRTAFRDAFTELSISYGRSIAYVPFLLDGVAGNPSLNQADGIHPNAQGARVIAELMYPKLRDMVDRLSAAAR